MLLKRTSRRIADPVAPGASRRIASIDIIRGAVMVLMAIDHVRVFSGLPPGGSTTGIFFTRWVTHFCAPAFIFLAGTSAYLYGRKYDDLSGFLLSRGIWLVFLELTFLRLAWTFNVDFVGYEMAGVIWVIGWSMIVLAGLIRLNIRTIALVGLAVIFLHNLVDPFLPDLVPAMLESQFSWFWKVLYLAWTGGPIEITSGGPNLIVLYTLIPWVGVMATGYAFGSIIVMEPDRRNRLCLRIGLGAVAVFAVLRGFNLYGDPAPWGANRGPGAPDLPILFDFLNTTKYPASLLFLLMTLGPTIALIPVLDGARGLLARWLTVFGRVPFFFYMLHIPLIHTMALLVSLTRSGTVDAWLFTNHPMGSPPPPADYVWSLPLLYAVWAVVTVLLFFACMWFADLKARRKDWWLSYL